MKQRVTMPPNGRYDAEPQSEGIEVWVREKDSSVQADITLSPARGVTIWGRVTDCSGRPVCGAPVTLLRDAGGCSGLLQEVARSTTDGQGDYRFALPCGRMGRYRVMVSTVMPPQPAVEQPPCWAAQCPPDPPCAPYAPNPPAAPWATPMAEQGWGSPSPPCRSIGRSRVQYDG
jgi:hypothetical protein